MIYQELHALLASARESNEKGDFSEAASLCNEIVAQLPEQNDDAGNWREILIIRSRSLRFLSAAYLETRESTDALAAGESALAAAIEAGSTIDEGYALSAIGWAYHYAGKNGVGLEYFHQAITIFEEMGDVESLGRTLYSQGVCYNGMGDYAKALESYRQSLAICEKLGISFRIAQLLGSIGMVYMILAEYSLALEYLQNALSVSQINGYKANLKGVIGNIGNTYMFLGDYTNALEYQYQALALEIEAGDKKGIAGNLNNIGETYINLTDYDKALEYLEKAMHGNEEIGNKEWLAINIGNIGMVYVTQAFKGYDAVKGEEYLLKATAMCEELGVHYMLIEFLKYLSDFYERVERWKDFASCLKRYHAIKDQVQSEETKNSVRQLEQQKQAAEQERALAIERAEADATKRLLHKTLPPSIAVRVIRGESRIADHFESASVLFADVVGFTKISSKMPPAAVLGFMNFIFEHFDAIATKYGCERIKTIGDGYMAVCGAPMTYPDHSERLALMALEMMEDVKLPEEIREHLPEGTLFHLRIGLHCGEITAGLIGTGKLAYDIYGDAVNTASRMESHGEPGRIHVSEDFAFHLQNRMAMTSDDLGGIVFEEREEIEIKGKGKMKTYFLER